MRVVAQRVSRASVEVNNKMFSTSGKGLLLYVGLKKGDTEKEVSAMVEKVINLRIFEDDNDKMNLSVMDINGEVSAVSQFTLYADTKRGRRPGFSEAMEPEKAKILYNRFVDLISSSGLKISTGSFGDFMMIESVNEGPATFIIEI